jgi:hypothetical protein
MSQLTLSASSLTKNVSDIPVNDQNLATLYPKRTIVDVSTDSFIKTIFSSDANYYLFLNYVNTLDFKLAYETNMKLLNLNVKPLFTRSTESHDKLEFDEEEVTVYFKGGNVMNYHFNKLVTNPVVKEKMQPFFKKSDFDFSVDIHTGSDKRFNILKNQVYEIIFNFLVETKKNFNLYLNAVQTDKMIESDLHRLNLANFRDRSLDEAFGKLLSSIKILLNKPFLDNTLDLSKYIDDKQIKSIKYEAGFLLIEFSKGADVGFVPDNPKLWDSFNLNSADVLNNINASLPFVTATKKTLREFYTIAHAKSKYHAAVIYPYYKYFIETRGDHEQEYAQLIENTIEYNFQLLIKSNFYTKDSIQMLINEIYNGLQLLNDTYYATSSKNPPDNTELLDPRAYNAYAVTKGVGSVKIAGRKDFVVYNDALRKDPGVVQTLSTDNSDETDLDLGVQQEDINVHYISGNFSILAGNRTTVNIDFDLFRIKFNLIAENIVTMNSVLQPRFNIPSEFIDVSISSIYATDYKHGVVRIINIPIASSIPDFSMPIPDLDVRSWSYEFFIEDLDRILFRDNIYPWAQSKYQKRLKRYLLLVGIYDDFNQTHQLKDLVDLSNAILAGNQDTKGIGQSQDQVKKYLKEDIYLNNYINLNSIKDLAFVPNSYDKTGNAMKFILAMNSILQRDQAQLVLQHFRRAAKLEGDVDIGTVKHEFQEFLKEISETGSDLLSAGKI